MPGFGIGGRRWLLPGWAIGGTKFLFPRAGHWSLPFWPIHLPSHVAHHLLLAFGHFIDAPLQPFQAVRWVPAIFSRECRGIAVNNNIGTYWR